MLTAVTDSTLQFFWFVQTQISSMLCCKREMLSVRACVCVSLYRSTVRLTRCVSVCFPAWVSCSACQLNVNREVLGSQRVSNFNPAIVPLPLLTNRSSGCTACSLQPAGRGGRSGTQDTPEDGEGQGVAECVCEQHSSSHGEGAHR